MSQKSITGLMPLSTGQNEFTTIKVNEIQGNRYSNNQIDFYEKDMQYKSTHNTNFIINGDNTNANSSFVIKNNTTEVLDIDSTSLDLKVGEYRSGGTALRLLTENLGGKTINGNFNNFSNIPTSALVAGDNLVLRTTAQSIGGVKTFNDGIVGDLTGNSDTATTLATSRKIGNQDFDGSQAVVLTTADLTDNNNIMLKDATQNITGSNTFSSNIIGNLTGNATTATTLATPRAIAGEDFDGSAPISLSSANLSNTADILLTNVEQTISSQKNFDSNGILTFGSGQPSTLPGVINCNGKIYVHGTSNKGLTIARHQLYDQVGSGNGTTRREWNIVCPSGNNKLRFNFLQQTDGGAITNEDVVFISSDGIETGLITTDKVQQVSGDLTLQTVDNMIFEVDSNNTGLANKYSFTDDGEEMVKIFRSSSNGVEHAMSKSYLSANGYIRAENSIIRNSNGIINLGAMLGTSSNTDSNEAGELRFNRYDPDGTENIRFHSIKTNCSATSATNSMKFFIHDATTTTSQSAIMLLTPQTALIYGTISVLGLCEFVSGAISANNNGFKYNNISGATNTTFAFKIVSNRVRCRINNAQEINISNTFSDKRLKSDIVECEDTTDIVNKIQVKKYTFGDTEFSKNNSFGFTKVENEVGIIADELMEIIPQAVQNTNEDELKTIEYDVIIPYLIKNLQQNNNIIAELNKKVEDLEETILGLME